MTEIKVREEKITNLLVKIRDDETESLVIRMYYLQELSDLALHFRWELKWEMKDKRTEDAE